MIKRFLRRAARAIRRIVKYFITQKCVACGESAGSILCGRCMKKLAAETTGVCASCGKRYAFCGCMPELLKNSGCSGMTYVMTYNKNVPSVSRALILKLKQQNRADGTELIADLLACALGNRAGWIVTNVPRSRQAVNDNGFDQAKELARELAYRCDGCIYLPLIKNIGEGQQKHRSYDERVTSAIASYKLNGRHDFRGRRILLVDDVITSGATMAECTRLLLEGGAEEVYAVAASRTQTITQKANNTI